MNKEIIIRDKVTYEEIERPCFVYHKKFNCFFNTTLICGECQK